MAMLSGRLLPSFCSLHSPWTPCLPSVERRLFTALSRGPLIGGPSLLLIMNTPMDISSWRKIYLNGKEPFLLEEQLPTKNPHKLFDIWFREVASMRDHIYEEVNTVCVSTVSADNRPSSRMVLMKAYSDEGFSFYTHYGSRKGVELTLNPNAAMLFYWPRMHKQIRVEGSISRLPMEAADQYWNSRPLPSRIGSKASTQSSVIPSRAYLEEKKKSLEEATSTEGESAAARPTDWGGYILKPRYFEFWQGQSDRLHDRIIFSLEPPKKGEEFVREAEDGWIMYRLSP